MNITEKAKTLYDELHFLATLSEPWIIHSPALHKILGLIRVETREEALRLALAQERYAKEKVAASSGDVDSELREWWGHRVKEYALVIEALQETAALDEF